MLSTKMMPAVGVLIPLYILCQFFGLLDNIIALIVIYALINLPIAVWMAYTYFCEVPGAILEAARIDGATIWGEMWHVLRPMTLPGLSSTGLLLIILSWNEAFWSLNLTSVRAAPLPVFIASYSSPEGLFWAKLSAASFLAVAPIMVLGWMTQKQLVRGLTFGAVGNEGGSLYELCRISSLLPRPARQEALRRLSSQNDQRMDGCRRDQATWSGRRLYPVCDR